MRAGVVVVALAGMVASGCATTKAPPPQPSAHVEPIPAEAQAEAEFMRGGLLQRDGRLLEAAEAYERAAEIDPESADLQRYLAVVWMQAGQAERALEHAERAFELDPDDDELRSHLASMYIALQRFDRAAEMLEPLLERGELSEEGVAALFGSYIKLGRPNDAVRIAEGMVVQTPDDPRAYLALGAAYEVSDKLEQAADAYRRALEIDPGQAVLYDRLGSVLMRAGDSEAEIALWERMLDEMPDDPRALKRIAEIQAEQGRRDEAIRVLMKLIRAHPGMLDAQLRLGLLYYEDGELAEAAARFEIVVRDAGVRNQPQFLHAGQYFLGLVYGETERENEALGVLAQIPPGTRRYADARRLMAWIYERRGQIDLAIIEAREAMASSDEAQRRRLGVFLAGLYQRNGDLDSALAVMNELIAEHPDDLDLLYDLGVIYGEAGEQEKALGVMDDVLARDPNHSAALNYVGYTWAERGERLDEAESMIRRAIELEPDDGYIIDSLGWVFYQRGLKLIAEGDGDAARQSFQRAIEHLEYALQQLDRADPIITWHLGDAYRSVSRFEEALQTYEEALELGPKEEDAEKIRIQIELLQLQLGSGDPGAGR